MSLDLYLVYVVACLVLLVTPGPNGLLCINHSVRFGPGRTFWTSLGSVAGVLLMIAASMAGLGAILLASEALFSLVKWLGATYLLFLAWQTWSAPASIIASAEKSALVLPKRQRVFAEGLGVAVSNPKALIFFATFLPQFIRPDEPLLAQFSILAGTFAALQLAYEVSLALTAKRMSAWLARHGKAFNRATACVFVGIAGMVLTSERAR
ncbi:LysE family translocator [Paenirhodobacter populi]|uniref:LysE family translocator n=1 Tax=Paenirhodobacter populi TaxID=2306993 RepID=A0A443J620_9RHOB|nr:LysE family translocator [Sinirhodobacter populi]RWR15918.1 LysE family translocator [Sinirhodobacter populi]